MSDLLLGGGLPPPTPSALTPVPAERPGNAQNASACRGKRLDRSLKTLKTRTRWGGVYLGTPRNLSGPFPRQAGEKGNQGTWRARGVSFEDVALLCWVLSNPFPRLAGGKGNRRHPTIAFSSTGRGKRESQAHGHNPMIAFSSTSRGKRNRKRMPMFP